MHYRANEILYLQPHPWVNGPQAAAIRGLCCRRLSGEFGDPGCDLNLILHAKPGGSYAHPYRCTERHGILRTGRCIACAGLSEGEACNHRAGARLLSGAANCVLEAESAGELAVRTQLSRRCERIERIGGDGPEGT